MRNFGEQASAPSGPLLLLKKKRAKPGVRVYLAGHSYTGGVKQRYNWWRVIGVDNSEWISTRLEAPTRRRSAAVKLALQALHHRDKI